MSTQPSANKPDAATVPPAAAAQAASRPPAAANAATRPPAAARRKTTLTAIGLTVTAALVIVAALALPRRSHIEGQPSMGQATDAQEHSIDPAAPSVAAPSASPTSAVGASGVQVGQGARPPVVVESPKKMPAKPAKRLATVSIAPPPASASVVEPSGRSEATAATVVTHASAPAPSSTTEVAGLAPVTMTGCLEVRASEDRFRLTDIEGDNAPKARNWRTGFLKKRSAAVNLVSVSDPDALERQVGKRVAATGVLTGSDLKVSSVRIVAADCNERAGSEIFSSRRRAPSPRTAAVGYAWGGTIVAYT